MISNYFKVFLLTFLPFLELRYSIPIGILSGSVKLPFGFYIEAYHLNPIRVFFVAVLANILIGIIIFWVLDYIEKYMIKSFLKKFYFKVLEKKRKKIRRYVDRYGTIGLALFIAIPLPGSGVYSGALGAKALGFKFKQFLIAEIFGVIIAGVIVTLISLGIILF